MKAITLEKIFDEVSSYQERQNPINIELPNGQKAQCNSFYFDVNQRGDPIIVLSTRKR